MGGNALKVKTERFDQFKYGFISFEVGRKLHEIGIRHFVTRSYDEKQDFGDLDVLITREYVPTSNDMYDLIVENFDTKEISRNKDVISFEYNGFQVDFILIDRENWEIAKIYYSYNDLGNLMGRIAANMGFRYGHFGLQYRYRNKKGGKILKLPISRDPEVIFAFLGFDYDQYKRGFASLNDIFRFVTYSKHFTTEIFQYSALNHQNRTRNKKRVNYNKFLEYISDKSNILPLDFDFSDRDFIDEAENYFKIDIKEKKKKFDVEIGESERNSKSVEHFNAEIIQEYFDIKGKEIGECINRFKIDVKTKFGVSWEDFVINNDTDFVMAHFCECNDLLNRTKK